MSVLENLNASLVKTKSRHAGEALEAAINIGFEITVPIWALDLVNDVTQKSRPVRPAFFRESDRELIEALEDKNGYT
jgi:hypothetical protein